MSSVAGCGVSRALTKPQVAKVGTADRTDNRLQSHENRQVSCKQVPCKGVAKMCDPLYWSLLWPSVTMLCSSHNLPHTSPPASAAMARSSAHRAVPLCSHIGSFWVSAIASVRLCCYLPQPHAQQGTFGHSREKPTETRPPPACVGLPAARHLLQGVQMAPSATRGDDNVSWCPNLTEDLASNATSL